MVSQQPNARGSESRSEPDEILITSEMVEAGEAALNAWGTSAEAVRWIDGLTWDGKSSAPTMLAEIYAAMAKAAPRAQA